MIVKIPQKHHKKHHHHHHHYAAASTLHQTWISPSQLIVSNDRQKQGFSSVTAPSTSSSSVPILAGPTYASTPRRVGDMYRHANTAARISQNPTASVKYDVKFAASTLPENVNLGSVHTFESIRLNPTSVASSKKNHEEPLEEPTADFDISKLDPQTKKPLAVGLTDDKSKSLTDSSKDLMAFE